MGTQIVLTNFSNGKDMNKSDSDKMYNISENTTESQSNSKEMEAYNQPILWPSLKQMNKNEFELR